MNPGIEPKSPALWPDSLTSEAPGKPRNTGERSLSLLQSIFLTQEGPVSEPGSPSLWADSLPAELQGKPPKPTVNFIFHAEVLEA